MATNRENIVTAIANITTQIATVSAATGPNYSVDGQQVDRVGYLDSLIRQKKELQEVLNGEDGSFELPSQGVT